MGKESTWLHCCSFAAKKPRPLHHWDLPDFHFQQYLYSVLYVYNSSVFQPMSPARGMCPSKSTTWTGATTGRYTSTKYVTRFRGPQADLLLRSRPSSHIDARPSKWRNNIRTKTESAMSLALHASIDRVPPIVSLKKDSSSFLLHFLFSFPFFSSFS